MHASCLPSATVTAIVLLPVYMLLLIHLLPSKQLSKLSKQLSPKTAALLINVEHQRHPLQHPV
jgi:hypothetical protein